MYSDDSIFMYDRSDEELEFPEPVKRVTGKIAGLDPSIADQLLDIVGNLMTVLMQNGELTREEAGKKVRWATYVMENRDT